MYYEEGRRPRGKKKRTLRRVLLSLFLKLILLAAAAGLILYALPVSLFMVESAPDLSPSPNLPLSRINILLLGVDKLTDGGQRADTIIIASIGYGRLALTSVLRDTMADIPGAGRGKINSAYNRGGAELTMRTLNENFGLNITKYALVDFTALADIVNAVGGVDIAVTQQEQTEINRNMADAWKVFKKLGYDKSVMSPLSLDFSRPDENGCVQAHLDGFQALGYARIRVLDSDFTRTHRQRRLINAILQRFRSRWYDPVMLYRLFHTALGKVTTNMGWAEMLSLGMKAAACGEPAQMRMPIDGSFRDDGSALTDVDFGANLRAFMEFIY